MECQHYKQHFNLLCHSACACGSFFTISTPEQQRDGNFSLRSHCVLICPTNPRVSIGCLSLNSSCKRYLISSYFVFTLCFHNYSFNLISASSFHAAGQGGNLSSDVRTFHFELSYQNLRQQKAVTVEGFTDIVPAETPRMSWSSHHFP